jgi:hypothetical protein
VWGIKSSEVKKEKKEKQKQRRKRRSREEMKGLIYDEGEWGPWQLARVRVRVSKG